MLLLNCINKKGVGMVRFIKKYALETYTTISMLLLVIAGILGDLSITQKFVLVYIFLFVLHEWEEMRYPGGFIESFAKILEINLTPELKKSSRIPTGVLLLVFTIVPFIFHNYPITILPIAFLGLFEGVVHIFAIKLFKSDKFYSPGLVTAELQAIVSIILFAYLISNSDLNGIEYLIGALIMLICYIILQKTITSMAGMKYSDLPKMLKKSLQNK